MLVSPKMGFQYQFKDRICRKNIERNNKHGHKIETIARKGKRRIYFA